MNKAMCKSGRRIKREHYLFGGRTIIRCADYPEGMKGELEGALIAKEVTYIAVYMRDGCFSSLCACDFHGSCER